MPAVTEWIDPCGLRVRIMGHSKVPRWRDWSYAFGVAWTLFKERNHYDVAYFLMQGAHLVTGLPMARLLGKPIVMKFSCSGLVAGMHDTFLGRVELNLLRWWARRILVLNPGMVDEALEAGIEGERLGWMPNPVDTEWFRPCGPERRFELRKELGLEADEPVAVFVGRLDHQKKLPWILGSFARVVRERPRAKLALVGDGPLREDVRRRIVELGLERNVIMTGRLSMSGVLQWLQAGDCFLLISEVEGLPCSLIEAMSVGLTPVVSRIPAHTQIVEDGVNGVLTELGDEESTARGVMRVFDDAELRQKLGAAARDLMLEQFSTARVVDRYEELFAECRVPGGGRAG